MARERGRCTSAVEFGPDVLDTTLDDLDVLGCRDGLTRVDTHEIDQAFQVVGEQQQVPHLPEGDEVSFVDVRHVPRVQAVDLAGVADLEVDEVSVLLVIRPDDHRDVTEPTIQSTFVVPEGAIEGRVQAPDEGADDQLEEGHQRRVGEAHDENEGDQQRADLSANRRREPSEEDVHHHQNDGCERGDSEDTKDAQLEPREVILDPEVHLALPFRPKAIDMDVAS